MEGSYSCAGNARNTIDPLSGNSRIPGICGQENVTKINNVLDVRFINVSNIWSLFEQ